MTRNNILNITELKDLLKKLSKKEYCQKIEILDNASIGQHVRHFLEFYLCLFQGQSNRMVNYDNRKRDLKIETEIDFALFTIEVILTKLENLKTDFPMTYIANYSIEKENQEKAIPTSLFRELAFNLEHSIHHQALLKVAIRQMNLNHVLSETFGYAPSTIRHKKDLCAQ